MSIRGTGRVSRVLKQALPRGFRGVYKINIVGSTGAGKTEFLKCLLGDLFEPNTEATRRTNTENMVDATHTWFRIGKEREESTTTVSLNTVGILLVRTLFNSIEFHPVKKVEELLLRDDIEEIWQFMFFDNAGQERFDFMPQITMRGADAVIVLADGTNMTSIEKISYFLELTREEEYRNSDPVFRIPVLILLNKKDLIERGCYIGLESVRHMIGASEGHDFYETSMKTGEGVDDGIRTLISRLYEREISRG
ncbi:MAG: GTP-binding protein [Candidatus Heimdallarchaeota archaeon]|nr:MAG: GTP-binding protein [Candidatus Heimdallarchaeota archaeon]